MFMTDGCVVECRYRHDQEPRCAVSGSRSPTSSTKADVSKRRWWQPIALRADKNHPNNRRTFYNTLTNIKEDIQWEEFCTLQCTKKRAREEQPSK